MIQHCWTTFTIMALVAFNQCVCFLTTIPVLNKMECKFNERFVNMTCFLSEPSTYTNQSISIEVDFLREIKEIKLTAAYYVFNGDSKNRILSRTVDLCSFVKRPNMDRLIRVFYDQIVENNRFISGCPVQEREQLYLRNIRPSAVRIPGFLPESNFMFENSYHSGVLFEAFVEVRYYGKLTRFLNDKPFEKQKNKIKRLTAT